MDNIEEDIADFKIKIQEKIDFCRNSVKLDLLGQLGETIESQFSKIEQGTSEECNFVIEVQTVFEIIISLNSYQNVDLSSDQ